MDTPFRCAVLGVGHFAAAVRVQLRTLGLDAADFDMGAHHVLLACSDYQCASSFADVNRRAMQARTRILFSWITHGRVEIGPLVVPLQSPCFECQATRIWDFSLDDFAYTPVSGPPRATLNPDTHLAQVACFGAQLVIRELRSLQLDLSATRLVGRVAEFDPSCIHPRLARLTRTPDCPVCGSATGANRRGPEEADGGY